MEKTSTLPITLLMLSFHIIIMHTSASDITLSLPQTTIKAQIGEELHITCLASKCRDEKPGFTWSNLVDSTLSGTVNTVEKKSTLTMKVGAETDGSYRCTVTCDNAPGEKRFHIVVYSLPSDPILHISSLVVGQQSHITCIFPNIYPYERLGAEILLDDKVVVTFDSEKIDLNIYEMQNISLTHDITLVEEMDKKEVKCLALLEFPDYAIDPIKRHTAQNLILMYPPELPQITVLTSTNVKAGEEIHLLCSSDSKSQAVVQWVKIMEDEELEMPSDDQGALILSNTVPENSGVYICYAENIAGKTASQVEINVQGLPEKPVLFFNPGTKVEAGQSVIIECIVYSNIKVTLWKMSEDRDMLLFLDSKGKTIIDEADPIDTAVYKCIAENQYGVSETSESLTVEYPPRETLLSSSPTDVNEGDTITLTCVSKGVPKPSISIYKLLTSGESVLLSKDPVVTLSEVTSGIYQCQANNRLGSDKDKLELIVQAPPKNTRIIITPSHTVRKGDSVHIQCISESSPAPKLVLRMETELGIIGLESEHGQYSISHAAVEHTGTYICESSNVIGQQIAEANLTVQAPPQNTQIFITPSSVVREGDNVQIRCTSEALPAPRLALKMKMEHDVVDLESEGGEYNISNAEVRHTGTYTCESTNAAGSEIVETTLNVEVPPRNTYITIIPSPVVREGDSVQIWCSSDGSPDPSLVLKMKTEFGLIMLELFDGSYNITHAGMENTGTYICESTNRVGNHVAETTLTVQIPPRNTTVVVTPSQNIKEGDTVTITCETHSIPSPTIILQKVCAKNNSVLQTNNGTFTLHNVTLNDTGTYTLQIISSAGNETEVINIQVQERQQSPRFNPTSIFIFGSVAFVSLGAIASIIYHLKKSKLQGSYSLVNALRSKV
ncbi:vascular cell adhesion protein 1 [Bufo gargarizans]|uniref:vascular cell adhesion protein 1 n=1 Tax=Bufo gargarizans TaxID=30331 RepID=UPI001CF41450|nr:vascular cell adhesion protein 1 [Bufo gargarizans]